MTALNAMIYAAGKGTRLQPLTLHTPKALVTIGEYPMLDFALAKAERLGASRCVVNIHHHAQQLRDYLEQRPSGNMEILISDESDGLLDTGGGLLKAAPLFETGADLLLLNADVLTNAPLEQLLLFHRQSQSLATLLVQERKASRYLLFDHTMQLAGWQNPATGEEIRLHAGQSDLHPYGFNGIQLLQHRFLNLIEPKEEKFSITPLYLQMAERHSIKGFIPQQAYEWFDIGSTDKLNKASKLFLSCSPEKRRTFF